MSNLYWQRRRLPHRRPGWTDVSALFFITINCLEVGRNQLCVGVTAEALRASVAYRNNLKQWHVRLLLLMPDHLHMLATFPHEVEMRRVVFDWKRFTSGSIGINWQRDFFDHRLRSDESRVEKAAYIRNNPVRKELVDHADAWPYVWDWDWN